MHLAQQTKRFTASGAINAADEKGSLVGITVKAVGDVSVDIYDATGTTLTDKIFGIHLQPGTSDHYLFCHRLRNGGYVQITGDGEVFVHLA